MLVDVAEQRALDHVSALMGGIPVNTAPVFASSASERPRTAAAAAAAPFRWRAIVSVFGQSANVRACWAFISSSMSRVKCAKGWPEAIVPHLSQVTPSTIGSSGAFGT